MLAGYLIPKASEHLGLPVGLPVAAGAADTAAAALGNGLLEPGLVQLTIGTAAQIITPRSQPIIDPQGRTHLYRWIGTAPHAIAFDAGSLGGSGVLLATGAGSA